MIKIEINAQGIACERIVKVFQDYSPHYTARIISGNLCAARRNWLIGVIIRQRKNNLVIRGDFPNPFLSLVFAIATVFTGLIPGIMGYYIWLLPKMKKAEKEVAGLLARQLASG